MAPLVEMGTVPDLPLAPPMEIGTAAGTSIVPLVEIGTVPDLPLAPPMEIGTVAYPCLQETANTIGKNLFQDKRLMGC